MTKRLFPVILAFLLVLLLTGSAFAIEERAGATTGSDIHTGYGGSKFDVESPITLHNFSVYSGTLGMTSCALLKNEVGYAVLSSGSIVAEDCILDTPIQLNGSSVDGYSYLAYFNFTNGLNFYYASVPFPVDSGYVNWTDGVSASDFSTSYPAIRGLEYLRFALPQSSSSILTEGLLAKWYLNDTYYNNSGDIKDAGIAYNGTGYGKNFSHGAVTGATWNNSDAVNSSSAKYGGYYDFDGGAEYIEVSNISAFDNSDQVTIGLHFKLNNFNNAGQIQSVLFHQGTINNYCRIRDLQDMYCSIYVDGAERIVWSDGAGGAGDSLNLDQWYYLTLSYDGTAVKMHLDGTEVDSTPASGKITKSGNLYFGSNGADRYNGSIDEVMIFNKSLSQTEIQENMNANAPYNSERILRYYGFNENSSSLALDQNHLTSGFRQEANTISEPAYNYEPAIYFDGVDDYIEIQDLPLVNKTSNFSISMWVNPQEVGNGKYQHLIGKDRHFLSTPTNVFGIDIEQSGKFWFSVGNGSNNVEALGGFAVANQWQNIVLRFTGNGTTDFYIDGNLSNSITTNMTSFQDLGKGIYLGKNNDTASLERFYNGSMADVRIYNRSISENEISTLYYGNQYVNIDAKSYSGGYPLNSWWVNYAGVNYTTSNNSVLLSLPFGESSFNFYNNEGYYNTTESTTVFGAGQTHSITLFDSDLTFNFDSHVYNNGNYTLKIYEKDTAYSENVAIGSSAVLKNVSSGNYTFSILTGSLVNASYNFTVPQGASAIDLTSFGISNATFFDENTGSPITLTPVTITYPNSDSLSLTTNENGTVFFSSASSSEIQNGTYNITFEDYLGFITPISFFPSYSIAQLPFNATYNLSRANIEINIYDRETEALINENVTVNILGLGEFITSNGTLYYSNITISSGTYSLYATAENYDTTQTNFVYTNQENLEINLYLMNSTADTRGNLFIITYDQFYTTQIGVDVRLKEYRNDTKSFVEVAQCLSDANGECVFSIELGKKLYLVTSTKEVNGVLLSAQSTETGSVISIDNTLIELHLNTESVFKLSELYDLQVVVSNSELINQTSYHLVDFYDGAGFTHEVCLGYYYIDTFRKVLLNESCETGSSGIINVLQGTVLNLNYTNIVEAYVKQDGAIITYYSQRYEGENSFGRVFALMAKPFLLFLSLLFLGLALHLKNINLFCYGHIFSTFLGGIFFPSIVNGIYASVSTVMCLSIIYMSRRKEGNNGS